MSIKNIKRGFLAVVALASFACAFAQTTFEKGKLYHIYAYGTKENVVYEMEDKAIGLTNFEKDNTAQYWKISELSGSWRIINPVTNHALRVNGNKVEVGENNGSDEAQLWKYEDGLLIPANSPNAAVAKSKKGLVIISREKAAENKAAQFRFEESAYVDGSGTLRTFFQIILPLSIPMMITVFLFAFCWQWTDDFYTTLFFTTGSKFTLMPDIVASLTLLQRRIFFFFPESRHCLPLYGKRLVVLRLPFLWRQCRLQHLFFLKKVQ